MEPFHDTTESTLPNPDIAPLSIASRIPAFWHHAPRLWFALAEQILAPQKCSDQDRFSYVIAQLDRTALQEVSDLVLQPPKQEKFEALKERLITTYEESETQRLQKLLYQTEMGSDKPSQLIRRMRTLNMGKLPDGTLKTLWLGHLPATIRAVLATSEEKELDKMANLADRMMEVTANERGDINKIEATTTNMTAIERKLEELAKQIERLQARRAEEDTSNTRSTRRLEEQKCCISLELQGPHFLIEPKHLLEFSNNTGGRLDCAGHGNPPPQVEWVEADGSSLPGVPGLRRMLPNGSLEFPSFPGAAYRRDVHATAYRCRLQSTTGHVVLSTETRVRAVVAQNYEIKVYDEYIITGNTALLRCQIPAYVGEYVTVDSWIQDGAINIYPNGDIGGKYTVLNSGDLYINDANPGDGFKSYSCRTTNRLTGETHSSSYPGHVIVTEPKGNVQPRITMEKHTTRRVAVGDKVVIACVAQGWPVPAYRWFKEHHDQLTSIQTNDRVALSSGGLLRISKIRLDDHGKYICWVNNSAGEETIQVTLIVTSSPTVHIQPTSQLVDVGKEATFQCNPGGHPFNRLHWLHNGKRITSGPRVDIVSDPDRLVIRQAGKEDAGSYQCFAGNDEREVQAVAELQLGDASPELIYWFSEQTLQPGPSVSLKCVASGSPPPQFSWTLDGFPVPENNRFVVGQYVTLHDDVISHVNISRVTEQDGGEYACVAHNPAGRASHAARVNVYGPPYIREMPKVVAVSGTDLVVKCPAAGYPIETVTWERDGQILPLNRRQRVYTNGTLVIEQVQRNEDAGTYTCQATNRQRHAARRDVEVQLIVPPKILPIQPMTNLLRDGMRAAISCQILEGDLPITFRWEKNGAPLLASGYGTGIISRRLDEYSTSLVIDHVTSSHSGNYTCVASNVAGTERFTVPLTVNVPPHWTVEPSDASAAAGQEVILQCQANGYPTPTITWKKSVANPPGDYKDFLFEPNVNLLPNGSLIFTKVTKDSESHYLCEAKNNIGTGLSKVIFLKINAPARFPSKSKTVQVTAGEQAHLQCSATGDNPIDITWRSQHHTIAHHLDPRYSIREQILDGSMVSELGILHAYRQDTGPLTCIASNAYGQDEMIIQLVVQEVPEMPKNIRIIDQQSRAIQISWSQPYAGNSPITSYIVQYKSGPEVWSPNPQKVAVPGGVTSATVQNLRPAKMYHLRIVAENRLGKSEPSQVIQVTTLEEVPGGPPLDVRAEAKSSTELIVTWEPPQKDLWNGNILGYYIGYQELEQNSTLRPLFEVSSAHTSGAAYSVKTVEGGAGGGAATLSALAAHTAYAVVVQAYNGRGAGPSSSPVTATTMEDVPSLPPDNVQCSVLSSQSIHVSWEPPPFSGRNGIIQGYKVTHVPLEEWTGKDDQVTKQIPMLRTNLAGLRRYTNYSINVAAFTSAGDGVKSQPVFCHTEEDVPTAPADIKAVMSSSNKILITWLPPKFSNGVLVGYTFYMGIIEDGREEGTHKRILSPSTTSHETTRNQEGATHQFWLTASTRVGEGESTRVVTILPSDKVPAKITSFSREIITPWKENISLPCHKVGIPTPSLLWTQHGSAIEPSPRRNITADGTLVISVTQHADSGNYTCSVENGHGHDEVTYGVTVKVPPQPPVLAAVDSFADSLQLQWTDQGDGGSPILGYVINYKRDHGDWEELQVEAGVTAHSLPNLWCGTRYQLYITAFNRIGTGLPCDIVNAFTKGTVPVKPKHSQMITVNATVVTVWLDSWGDGGCGILYFVIEYKEISQTQWRLVSNSVQATERVFSISNLIPSTQYQLKITAHNNAGYAVAYYNITTHTVLGRTLEPELSPPVSHSGGDRPFYTNMKVVLPVTLSLLVLLALIAIVLLIKRNKVISTPATNTTGVGESPSVAQFQNKVNRDHQYLAARGRQPVPTDDESSHRYNNEANSNEYMEDICPYATFQLTKPTYSESSYSGNVYSGPYHSVRGSFVYHDVKQGDKYKSGHGKEPEYTKLPRKGGTRLRDPHSESQESDNLGSTDSEVKKILTLHLPITEYEDDCSDEGGSSEEGQRRGPPPRNLHNRPALQPASTGAYPAMGPEESSSSSETSLGGVVRKAFPSRKGKAAVQGKRHVRSSSGYSSHNDETTFSISNYPSFNEHIHPPSRFSDDTECEANVRSQISRRKRAPHGNDGKLPRETFQINV